MVYLKSIESHGFKSFADKVTIQFDQGLTSVVGPNGSGKSNITDAIRWVFGEQSAKTMRGASMQDVIFNGTKNRKPMNSAYVKLILDNSDKMLSQDNDEVSIIRKLYRSGESEYFINNKKSKLKDITELFMDSGLGKSAYNIISQGEVDYLLKAKPEERRQLIEEAAGVMKYKSRKKESVKKLEETKDNLSRVNDIIVELTSRVEVLEEESVAAEKYLSLKEEMSQVDIEVTVYDIKTLLERLKVETDAIESEETKMSDARIRVGEINTELITARENNERFETDIKAGNETILNLTKTIEKLSGTINLYEERKINQKKTESDLVHSESELRTSIDEYEGELTELNKEKNKIVMDLQDVKELKLRKQKDHESLMSSDDSEIEELRNEYFELSVQKTSIENEEKERQKKQEQSIEQHSLKERRLESLREGLQSLNKTHLEKKEILETLIETRNELREKYQGLTDTNQKLSEKITKLEVEKSNVHHKRTQQSSRLNVLSTMEEEYRGYFPGVRTVLKHRGQLNGVVGSIGEIIQVTDEYVTALETALGAQSQNIVMDTERDAKEAIRFLKEKRHGFATFLPLDTIQSRALSRERLTTIMNTTIDAHVFSDVVEVSPKYEAAIKYLLGTTVVVDTIDEATELSKQLSYRVRIVTKSGETVLPGGALSGGSKTNQSSIVETKNEIRSLKQSLKTLTEQEKKLDSVLREYNVDRDKQKSDLDALIESGNLKNEEIDGVEKEIIEIEMRIAHHEENITLLNEELNFETSDENDDGTKRLAEIVQKLESISSRLSLFNASEEEKQEQLFKLNNDINALNTELTSKEIQLNHINDRILSVKKQLKDKEKQLQIISENLVLIRDDSNLNDLPTMLEDKVKYEEELSHIEDKVASMDEQLMDGRRHLNGLLEDKETLNEALDKMNERLRKASGQKGKIDAQLDNKITYLSESYKTTYENESSRYTEFNNIDEKRQIIQKNKREIEALGPVNISAIEEYKIVDERYKFLKEQESDLLVAHATLMNIIKEMDHEVSTRFKDVFHQVNDYFQEVFIEMFGGGHAELSLTEPGNYLESGIEILAEPPGKKLSSLSLLSGGERALTTISLLFSILRVRVSPFIILDEVEAALDEANVIRYARYIQNLSKQSQFIVITHRKGTMEHSDRLFGITMAERGVSSLISVDLNNYSDTIGEEMKS